MTSFALLAAVIAVGGCLLLGAVAPAAVLRLRPGQAVPLLTWAALALSLACGAALSAIAAAVLAAVGAVAAEGHWSAALLRAQLPLPFWLGAAAALAVALLLGRTAWRTARIGIELVRADRLSRSLRRRGGPVVVLDDDAAGAYTVAGIRGCVVLSRRLLDSLDADQRRVVTAHELSHLRRRHHLYLHVVDVAAAANPLLRRVPATVRLGVERWADEDAATGVGDRRLTGTSLARVALLRRALDRSATGSGPVGATVLGIVHGATVARVEALLRPAQRRRTGRVLVAAALALAVLGFGLASLDHIQDAIEAAAR